MKIGIDARCLEWRRGGVSRILVNVLKIWQKKSRHNFILYFQNYIPDDDFLQHPNFKLKLLKGPKLLRIHRIIAEQILMPSQLKKDNLELQLTEKETELLVLFSKKQEPLSRNFVLENVWKYSAETDTHTVETHIHRLRKKFLDKFKDKNFIKNNNKGYYI